MSYVIPAPDQKQAYDKEKRQRLLLPLLPIMDSLWAGVGGIANQTENGWGLGCIDRVQHRALSVFLPFYATPLHWGGSW